MDYFKLKKLLIFFSALSLSLGILSVPSQAFTLQHPSNSNFQGWRESELKIRIDSRSCGMDSNQFKTLVESSMAVWNAIPTSSLKLKRGKSISVNIDQALNGNASYYPLIVCDPNFGSTFDLNFDINSSGKQAVDVIPGNTLTGARGDYFEIGVIVLNAQNGAEANVANLSDQKLTLILAHELGHIIGLGHTEEESALMYFDISQKSEINLAQDDIDGASYLYPRNELTLGDGAFGCGSLNQRGNFPQDPLTLVWNFLAMALLVGISYILIRQGGIKR